MNKNAIAGEVPLEGSPGKLAWQVHLANERRASNCIMFT